MVFVRRLSASPEIGARIAEGSRAPQAAPVRVRGAATLARRDGRDARAAGRRHLCGAASGCARGSRLPDGDRRTPLGAAGRWFPHGQDLDAGTQLGVRYDRGGRHIVLEQGRAFFQAAKDAARPFDVVTDAGSVRALGTQFEVSQVAGAADVALYEGSVELRARGVRGAAAAPGRAGAGPAGAPVRRPHADARDDRGRRRATGMAERTPRSSATRRSPRPWPSSTATARPAWCWRIRPRAPARP